MFALGCYVLTMEQQLFKLTHYHEIEQLQMSMADHVWSLEEVAECSD